jgi:hypothetical protein
MRATNLLCDTGQLAPKAGVRVACHRNEQAMNKSSHTFTLQSFRVDRFRRGKRAGEIGNRDSHQGECSVQRDRLSAPQSRKTCLGVWVVTWVNTWSCAKAHGATRQAGTRRSPSLQDHATLIFGSNEPIESSTEENEDAGLQDLSLISDLLAGVARWAFNRTHVV